MLEDGKVNDARTKAPDDVQTHLDLLASTLTMSSGSSNSSRGSILSTCVPSVGRQYCVRKPTRSGQVRFEEHRSIEHNANVVSADRVLILFSHFLFSSALQDRHFATAAVNNAVRLCFITDFPL